MCWKGRPLAEICASSFRPEERNTRNASSPVATVSAVGDYRQVREQVCVCEETLIWHPLPSYNPWPLRLLQRKKTAKKSVEESRRKCLNSWDSVSDLFFARAVCVLVLTCITDSILVKVCVWPSILKVQTTLRFCDLHSYLLFLPVFCPICLSSVCVFVWTFANIACGTLYTSFVLCLHASHRSLKSLNFCFWKCRSKKRALNCLEFKKGRH